MHALACAPGNGQTVEVEACDMDACCSTAAKSQAMHSRDSVLSGIIDNLIDLWSKMVNADHEHDTKIERNVEGLQLRADEAAKSLADKLAKLRLSSAEANDERLPGHEFLPPSDKEQGAQASMPSPTVLFDKDKMLGDKDAEIQTLQKQLSMAQKRQDDYDELLADMEMSKDEALTRASRAQVVHREHKAQMP